MENGSILIVVIIAAIAGRRSVYIGSLCGVIVTVLFFFIFKTFDLKTFAIELLVGTVASIIVSAMAHVLFPGLKGGGHNSGPSFIGGGNNGGIHGGIVHTNEERKARRENQNIIP